MIPAIIAFVILCWWDPLNPGGKSKGSGSKSSKGGRTTVTAARPVKSKSKGGAAFLFVVVLAVGAVYVWGSHPELLDQITKGLGK